MRDKLKTIIKGVVLLAVGIVLVCVAEQSAKKSGGIHDVWLSETAIIEEIDRAKRQITVKMLDQDNIYIEEEDENPYDKDKVVLKYTEKKEFYVSELKVSDEVIFSHFYDTPYRIERIESIEKKE